MGLEISVLVAWMWSKVMDAMRALTTEWMELPSYIVHG